MRRGIIMKRAGRLTNALPVVVILAGVAACGGDAGPTPPTPTPPTPPPPPPPPVAPVQVGTIPNQTVATGQTATLDVSSFFRDPDGGALTYTAESSAPAVVSVSLSGSTLTLTGVAEGSGTVTVTARDPGGLTAAQSFGVTVETPNRAPEPVGTIQDRSIEPGRTATVDVSSYFQDPDGDALVYAASSSDAGVATARTAGSDLLIDAIAEGTATVTVTATDPGNLSATQAFDVTVSGSSVTNLTNHSADEATPAWSPDGNQIAFTSFRDDANAPEIYVMNADGSGQTNLTNHPASDAEAAWSPDGTRIAFSSDRGDRGGNSEIYVMNADGSGVTRLTNHSARDGSPAWSPDGTRIAFGSARDGNWDIYAMNADGSRVARLTNNAALDLYPAWSPDGARIAFTSERDGNREIYVMNGDGSGVTRLTDHSAYDWDPAWSPDGVRIAFTSRRDGNHQIHVMNANGTGVTQLTDHSAGNWGPVWSPDGARIAFTSDRDGNFEVYVLNVPVLPPPPPPAAPVPVGTIPSQTVAGGRTATLDVSSFFRDPDGGALTYTAASSAPAVVSVSMSGSTLTMAGVADGSGTVTVTARDPDGLTAAQSFQVTVETPNRAPETVGTIPGQSLEPGRTATVDVSSYFQDPDGDALTYTAASSAPAVVSVSLSGSALTMAGVADGTATVTVTATDPDSVSAVQEFDVTVSGSRVTNLTNHSADEGSPAWSPDGARIAFTSDRDGNTEIYAMNADGSGVTRLTDHSAFDGGAAWSPDGARIAFTSDRGGITDIYAMNADGSGVTNLTNHSAHDSHPTWSPDGTRIAFASRRDGNAEIYAMNADGSGVTRLTSDSELDLHPAWSPDGARIAFTSYRDGDPEIYVMNADGSGVTRLTNRNARVPAWSPDGARIAFAAGRGDNYEIYVMNANGSGVTPVTSHSAFDYEPAWSPDGSRIAFTTDRDDPDGNHEIYVLNVPALPPPPPPAAPVPVGTIPNQAVAVGQTATLDVSSFFRDPDGGALAYTAASSAPAVVSVAMSGSTLTMAGVAEGTGTVTVAARDPDGLTAEQRFNVAVGGGGGDDHSCVRGRETVLAWAGSATGVLTAGDEDCFVVVMPAAATAGRLTAWTTGDTDTYGTLYDSSYGLIDENDDWVLSSDFNFLVAHAAASPGRYFIRVRGYDSDESGPYTIHVDDHGDSFESATVDWEALGLTFASLANAGSIAAPGDRDFFAFFLFESALTSVGTTGSMDTFGTLYDEAGEWIAEDDDSGPDRNFRIERQLEAGIYFVEVRGVGNSTGSYELGVGAVGARHSAYPAWSPDGSRIAFTSDRDGRVDIYVMNADGSGVRRLTNDAAWSLIPAWSPDGSRIAFTSSRGDSLDILVMRADGSGVRRLTGGSEWNDASPAWSPDGSRIAFASDRDTNDSDPDTFDAFEIYVMNADGSGVTRLTHNSEWDDGFPAWSPDGSRIAFASDRADGSNYQIHVMRADGSGVTRLTGGRQGWEATAPVWSPDGSRIAFSSDRDDDLDIYAMNADGTGVTRLTRDPAEDFWATWSPDGSRIAFTSNRDGNFEIYAMNADGTGVRRLTTTTAEGDAAEGDAVNGHFSEWLRGGSGPAFRFAPDRGDGARSADGAVPAGRDALLGPVPRQPVPKGTPQRRGGQRR